LIFGAVAVAVVLEEKGLLHPIGLAEVPVVEPHEHKLCSVLHL
jgi:hypothetical protein